MTDSDVVEFRFNVGGSAGQLKGTAVPESCCAIDTDSHNLGAMGQVTRTGRCGTHPSIRWGAVAHFAAGLDEGIARCQERYGPLGPQDSRS